MHTGAHAQVLLYWACAYHLGRAPPPHSRRHRRQESKVRARCRRGEFRPQVRRNRRRPPPMATPRSPRGRPHARLSKPWRAWEDEQSRLATGACGPLAMRLHRTRQLVAETSAQVRRHRRPLRHLKPDRAGRPAVRRPRLRRLGSDRQESAAATERSRAGPAGRRRSGGCRYCKRPRPNPSRRRARYHTTMETHAATTGHRCRGCRRTTSL